MRLLLNLVRDCQMVMSCIKFNIASIMIITTVFTWQYIMAPLHFLMRAFGIMKSLTVVSLLSVAD